MFRIKKSASRRMRQNFAARRRRAIRPEMLESRIALTGGPSAAGFDRIFAAQSFDTGLRDAGLLAHADIDGDGFTDVVTAEAFGGDSFSILFGKAGGNFASPRVFGFEGILSTYALSVRDVDSDGRPEIIAANSTNGFSVSNVTVLRLTQAGDFEVRSVHQVGAKPVAILTSDFDGDGTVDIATANELGRSVSVLSGRGDGTFAEAVETALNGQAVTFAAGDFDRDGRPDLAVIERTEDYFFPDSFRVLRNVGGGTFATSFEHKPGGLIFAIAVGDFDGNGATDIVTARDAPRSENLLTFHSGRGDGTFADPAETAMFENASGSIRSIVTGDFDQDGNLDAIGLFSGVLLKSYEVPGGEPVEAGFSRGSALLLKGTGGGQFEVTADMFAGSFPQTVAVNDLDGDGVLDLIASTARGRITTIPGLGDGSFEAMTEIPVRSLSRVDSGDFDGDGRRDLILTPFRAWPFSEPRVTLLKATADGSFESWVNFAVGSLPQVLSVADFDGDGRSDFATIDAAGNGSIWLGSPDGNFPKYADFVVPADPVSLAVGDIDGDGFPDLVTAGRYENRLVVLHGNGRGAFVRQPDLPVAPEVRSIVFADIDGNSDPDLVVTHDARFRTVEIMLNRGDGTFEILNYDNLAFGASYATAGDMDGNGTTDLVLVDLNSWITIWPGRGDGTFETPVRVDTGLLSYNRVHIGDFDGDRRPDIAAIEYGRNISILRNNPDGTFAPFGHYAAGNLSVTGEVLADFDRDGDLDIISADGQWLRILSNRTDGAAPVDPKGPNLVIDSVTVTPSSIDIGKGLEIAYSIRNAGAGNVSAGWADSVYLSRDDRFDASDLRLSTIVRRGGIVAGGVDRSTIDVSIPAFAGFVPGEWFVIVRTDVRSNIRESDESDNAGAVRIQVNLDVTPLELEKSKAFELAAGESRYFAVPFEAGQPVSVQLEGLPADGIVGLYVKRDGIPEVTVSDRSATTAFVAEQFVNMPPQPVAGTLYVLVRSASLTASPLAARITATQPAFSVRTTQFGTGANGGNMSIRVLGAGFDDSIKVSLATPGQAPRFALSANRLSDEELSATFDLRGLAPGTYDVVFANGAGRSVTVQRSLVVIEAGSRTESGFSAKVILPSAIRRGTVATAQVEYRNDSFNDIEVPLLSLSSTDGKVSLSRSGSEFRQVVRMLAVPDVGPVGILRPGQTFVRNFYIQKEDAGTMEVGLSVLEAGKPGWDAPTDWKAALGFLDSDFPGRPETVAERFEALGATLGRTNGEYVERLRNVAAMYMDMGERIYDAHVLENFLLMTIGPPTASVVPTRLESPGVMSARDMTMPMAEARAAHPTSAYAWDWAERRWKDTLLAPADVMQGAYTVVIVHGWKNNLTDTWVPSMATALQDHYVRRTGSTQPQVNILGVDWGDVAQHDEIFPYYSANGIPAVARTIVQQFLSAGLSPERMHIIGHSHGAHIAGMIGEEYQRLGIGTVDRISTLDSSEEHAHAGAIGNELGRGWGANRDSARYIDSYKSSQLLGGERAWGHDNFLLVRDGLTWNGGNVGNAHGYAQEWYLRTIADGGGKHQLGYGWGPESWRILTAEVPGYESQNAAWKGLIRGSDNGDHVVELISQAVGSPDIENWNYPGEWLSDPDSINTTGFSDGGHIDRIIQDMAKSVDLSVSVVLAQGEWKAAERAKLSFMLGNDADNRSVPGLLRAGTFSLILPKLGPSGSVNVYLSQDESLGNDILLKSDAIPFLGARGASDFEKPIQFDLTLPEESVIEAKWSRELPGGYFLIIDAASKYQYELNAKNNVSVFPITIRGEDLGANPGGAYGATDEDRNGFESIALNGALSGPRERIVSYLWKSGGVPIGNTSSLAHNFRVGTHEVTLTIVDEDGNSDTATTVVRVRPTREEPVPPPFEPKAKTTVVTSFDPNDIIGPAGVGPLNHIVATNVMPYTIRFENDPRKASAPAALVTITQTLDPDLDWSTFRLGDMGFGDLVVNVPDGLATFETRVDLTASKGFFVDIRAGVNVSTGVIRWEFLTIDPATRDLPEDPFAGFLPPNRISPEGEGFVNYTIRPKTGVRSGDRVDAVASIVFDVNEPIVTPPIFHTFDTGSPASRVNPLPATTTTARFTVSWAGSDDPGGSGIGRYDVFVSRNGGPFELWIGGTAVTSAPFEGQPDSTYAFFSRATDLVGFAEVQKSMPEASTRVVVPPPVDPDPVAPSIVGVKIDEGRPQRSRITHLTVTFDTVVSIDPQAFTIAGNRRFAPGVRFVSQNVVAGRTELKLGFSGPFVRGGSLPDGLYRLMVRPDRVRNRAGVPISNSGASNGVIRIASFHRLFGDLDGDGRVDRTDREIVRSWLPNPSQGAIYDAALDFDGNGRLNGFDMTQFRGRLGRRIPPRTSPWFTFPK